MGRKLDVNKTTSVPSGKTAALEWNVKNMFRSVPPQHSSTHQTNPSVRRMDGDNFITPGFAALHPRLRSYALSELWIPTMNWWL